MSVTKMQISAPPTF